MPPATTSKISVPSEVIFSSTEKLPADKNLSPANRLIHLAYRSIGSLLLSDGRFVGAGRTILEETPSTGTPSLERTILVKVPSSLTLLT